MAFSKLFGKRLAERSHANIEFLLCDIHIFNFNVEILTSRKGIVFLLNIVIRHTNREIINSFTFTESGNNFFHLKITQPLLLVVTFFIFFT